MLWKPLSCRSQWGKRYGNNCQWFKVEKAV